MGKKLNLIKKLLKIPFVIIATPVVLIVVFFATDWEDPSEVVFAKKFLKNYYW